MKSNTRHFVSLFFRTFRYFKGAVENTSLKETVTIKFTVFLMFTKFNTIKELQKNNYNNIYCYNTLFYVSYLITINLKINDSEIDFIRKIV